MTWLRNIIFSRLRSHSMPYFCTAHRYSTSALYVTGDKASETCSVLTPHVDFENRFQDVYKLKRNVELRGLSINIDKLKILLEMFKEVNGHKIILEKCRAEVVSRMNNLKTNGDSEEVRAQKEKQYRHEGKLIRDDLKSLMKGLWDLEGNAMLKVLALPNDLHPDTPECEPTVFYVNKPWPNFKAPESHIQLGKRLGVLKYENETSYFLVGDGALLELGALYFFEKQFQDANFVQISNTDFGRSVIVEGVGIKHKDAGESLILKSEDEIVNDNDRLHLVGGASLVSFSAFHTKQVITPQSLPSRYFTLGRQYSPSYGLPDGGLLNVWQGSALEFFIATASIESMMSEFEHAVKLLISAYEQLGCHFRVAFLPAPDLRHWESLRASVQMFSTHLQCYVEVGNVCLCGDFVSKRLLTSYQDSVTSETKYVNVVSGNAVCVPKLLACLLEENPATDRLSIPDCIRQYVPGG